jgi:hypothetical protein
MIGNGTHFDDFIRLRHAKYKAMSAIEYMRPLNNKKSKAKKKKSVQIEPLEQAEPSAEATDHNDVYETMCLEATQRVKNNVNL